MNGPPDLGRPFYVAFVNACERMGIDPLALIRVLYSESGVRASAHNPHGNASGIFQAMPATLDGLGWKTGWQSFCELSAWQQVPYMESYFTRHGQHCKTDALCYVACFLPALLPKAAEMGDEYVLCGQRGPLAWAYGANRGLDANGDGAITVGDLGKRLEDVCHGPRYEAIVWGLREAMGLEPAPIPEPPPTLPELPVAEDDGGAARRGATLDTVADLAREDLDDK